MSVLENFKKIKDNVNKINVNTTIIAISKTFSLQHIRPLIDFGHLHYGENKVQETSDKWSDLLNVNSSLKLHLVGKLQSNKAYDAVKLFSYIHSLDNEKLALKLAKSEKELSKKLSYFIQVNFSDEKQKSGISEKNLSNFIKFCKVENNLNLIGLMCLPPVNIDPTDYFLRLKHLAKEFNLDQLSMGMSGDYKNAIKCGSTYIRIGSSIFGNRS
jgi:pyridoxal phosphate enzyme (YggS family)